MLSTGPGLKGPQRLAPLLILNLFNSPEPRPRGLLPVCASVVRVPCSGGEVQSDVTRPMRHVNDHCTDTCQVFTVVLPAPTAVTGFL